MWAAEVYRLATQVAGEGGRVRDAIDEKTSHLRHAVASKTGTVAAASWVRDALTQSTEAAWRGVVAATRLDQRMEGSNKSQKRMAKRSREEINLRRLSTACEKLASGGAAVDDDGKESQKYSVLDLDAEDRRLFEKYVKVAQEKLTAIEALEGDQAPSDEELLEYGRKVAFFTGLLDEQSLFKSTERVGGVANNKLTFSSLMSQEEKNSEISTHIRTKNKARKVMANQLFNNKVGPALSTEGGVPNATTSEADELEDVPTLPLPPDDGNDDNGAATAMGTPSTESGRNTTSSRASHARRGHGLDHQSLHADRKQLLGTSGVVQRRGGNAHGVDGDENAATQAVLKHHEKEQEALTEELATMAGQLKNAALEMGKQVRTDNQVLDETAGLVTANQDKMKTENTRLGELISTSSSSTLTTWVILILVILVFIGMFIFIKITPTPKR